MRTDEQFLQQNPAAMPNGVVSNTSGCVLRSFSIHNFKFAAKTRRASCRTGETLASFRRVVCDEAVLVLFCSSKPTRAVRRAERESAEER